MENIAGAGLGLGLCENCLVSLPLLEYFGGRLLILLLTVSSLMLECCSARHAGGGVAHALWPNSSLLVEMDAAPEAGGCSSSHLHTDIAAGGCISGLNWDCEESDLEFASAVLKPLVPSLKFYLKICSVVSVGNRRLGDGVAGGADQLLGPCGDCSLLSQLSLHCPAAGDGSIADMREDRVVLPAAGTERLLKAAAARS
ncbi:hypothetical protein Nepgr_024780 [Nepenthes gracilis]|uniref:Uncharacterized protein n=1 Tax=Nepenthes gracilis TaxID=150966 RepID=A0AAD3T6K4_NEPGR|nr:hypothetical protein Nepgr_024780 [Nepenthes gracilis]